MNISSNDPIVLCGGVRTPIGQTAKALADFEPVELMTNTIRETVRRLALDPAAIEAAIIGWVGQDVKAPNIARVSILKSGLREEIPGFTVQCNCVSSVESIASAAKMIITGEAGVVLAGGVEAMSRFPYLIQGPRSHKALRSLETVKDQWAVLWSTEGVFISDTVELGLTDPVKLVNMAGTAEICAQNYGVDRAEQDRYAHESFRRCLEAQNRGFYGKHVFPAERDGVVALERDEYPSLRSGLIEKPAMFSKAPVLFDSPTLRLADFYKQFSIFMNKPYKEGASKASVTLFNSCPKSDGASAVLVTRRSRAMALGMTPRVAIRSWSFYGNNPAYMGVGPALAADEALKRAGLPFEELDQIELHEPFAATVLSLFKLGREKFGHAWMEKWQDKKLNPNGGSLALGHPLGATGARLALNLLGAFEENPNSRHGMIAACSGGGVGAAMVFDKI